VWLDCPFKRLREAKEAFPLVLIFVWNMFYNGLWHKKRREVKT